ncbi:hypothetical protein E2C01_035879 [Portunus trituberculatus]|uniref:Uncharacterized protein n=1 Tax=Portunus trituberculatus TaxID=210409 RepID=A0A5B7F749_PORTR|nr:hypothetical protein [Portunus trituberculatus]
MCWCTVATQTSTITTLSSARHPTPACHPKEFLWCCSVLRRGMVSISFSIVSLEFTIIFWKLVRAVSVTTVRLLEERGVSETVDRLCGSNDDM